MKKMLTVDELNVRAKKRVVFIIIVGVMMTAADFIATLQDDIKLVESNNKIYMVRPEEGGENAHTSFNATVEGKKGNVEKRVNVSIEPYTNKEESTEKKTDNKGVMSEKERLEYELKNVIDDFNKDRRSKKILLPQKLETGENISWESTGTGNGAVVIMCTLILAFLVFKTRLSPLEKEKKSQQESIIRQLPEFVNKLVLLLNAGLVLNSAFEKAIEESLRFKNNNNEYFHKKLGEGYRTVKSTNGSINVEFRKFARESGTKELMRISNIINDNINKGVELTDKLQRESEVLWMNRKKNCEEKGRLAETKLTLPLVIFLMVLIVITVAPAMLEL